MIEKYQAALSNLIETIADSEYCDKFMKAAPVAWAGVLDAIHEADLLLLQPVKCEECNALYGQYHTGECERGKMVNG